MTFPDNPPASIRRWASDVAVSGYTAPMTGLSTCPTGIAKLFEAGRVPLRGGYFTPPFSGVLGPQAECVNPRIAV
jgi:hypothetical protein